MQLAPVPFTAELSITVPGTGPSEFWLFDLSGRALLHERFTASVLLPTGRLSAGPYFYAVRQADGRVGRGKVVKE